MPRSSEAEQASLTLASRRLPVTFVVVGSRRESKTRRRKGDTMTPANDNGLFGDELLYRSSGRFCLVREGRVRWITGPEASEFLLSKVRALPPDLEPIPYVLSAG
jgi:hypothetical protein